MAVAWRNPLDSLDINQDRHISPLDALLVINDLNTKGSRALASAHPEAEPYIDANGDQFVSPIDALLVINALNIGDGSTRVLTESSATLAREKTITMTVGQPAGTRRLSFQIDTSFDATSVDSLSRDVLNVYVVDHRDESTTLLDRGQAGSPIFSLHENHVEATAGLATWDGRILEIDVGSLSGRDSVAIKLQLISGDKDLGTSIRVTPVDNRLLADIAPAASLSELESLAAVDGTADVNALAATNQLLGKLQNVRFNSKSGLYEAELSIENNGPGLGRDAAVLLPGLPAGVTAVNASGTTAGGVPYWNLRSAIGAGGLASNERSQAIPVQLSAAGHTPFVFKPQFIVGAANRAPVLAQPAPLTVSPGSTIESTLSAIDPDGDVLRYAIVNLSDLPTGSLEPSGVIKFSPTPDQLGSYTVIVEATDGRLVDRKEWVLTVAADTQTTTRISGRVLDVDGQPLSGLRVEVASAQGLTDSSGQFLLELGAGAPVTDTIRIRGDLFSGGSQYPFIAEKLPLLLEHPVYNGFHNAVVRPIYLPRLNPGSPVNPTQDTTVTSTVRENLAPAEVKIKAGTLLTQQGTPFTGALSITEVPVDRTPAALPAGLKPDLVVTIQPGEMTFGVPAPLSLPNRAGYAPGTVMDLWSINPVSGQFEKVGVGQVSTTGEVIQTVTGGIRNSSWHFFVPPPEEPQDPNDNDYNEDDDCEVCRGRTNFTSEVDDHSGVVYESHDLVTYQSLGQTRGLRLAYSSEWADPQHIVHFGYNNARYSPGRRMVASMSLNRGAFSQQVPGFQLRKSQPTDFHDSPFGAGFSASVFPPVFDRTLSFSGTAGQVLAFDSVSVGGVSSTRIFVSITDDQGTRIRDETLSGEGPLNTLPLVLTRTGNYTVHLSTSNWVEDHTVHFWLRDVSDFGLRGGEHFWAIPESGGNIDAALLVDMSHLPSGVYDYTLQTGLLQFTDVDFAGSTSSSNSHLVHVNRVSSPVGSGWGLEGVQEIVENPDGSLLLIDGGGSDQRFGKPPSAGEPYVSPAGDFTVIEKLPSGAFRRTTPDRTVYSFNARNQLESIRDRNGNVTQYVYDAGGRLTEVVDPVGLSTVLTYTSDRVTTITDPANRVTQLQYDSSGNLVRITDPDGGARTFSYDARHRMVSEVDQLGRREEASYNFAGRATRALRKDGSTVRVYPAQVAGLFPAEQTIDPLNAPDARDRTPATSTFVDGNGNVIRRTLNRGGQVLSTNDGLGPAPVTGYNGQGLPSNTTDSRGNTTLFAYDSHGNLTRLFDDLSAGLETVTGLIATPGAENRYSFQLTAPTKLYFDGLGGNYQATLSGPEGDVFSYQRFDSETYEAVPNLPAGSYTLTVGGVSDQTGQYEFRIRSLDASAPLPLGGTINGALVPDGETDLYSFSAASGDRFNFRALTSDWPLSWRLIDPDGRELFYSDFTTINDRVLGVTGTYYLLVEGFSDGAESNSYSFSVQPLGNQPVELPEGTELSLGAVIDATLESATDIDVYRLNLTDTTSLYFDMLGWTGNVYWKLTGPSGVVTEQWFSDSQYFAWNDELVNLPPGDYALALNRAGAEGGQYSFRLLDLASGSQVVPGQSTNSTLSPLNETDVYHFTAAAGQTYYFDMQNDTRLGYARWRLLDPRYQEVFEQYFDDADVQTLAVSGQYTLLVEGYYVSAGENGQYKFNVQPVVNAPPQVLSLGTATSGEIGVTGEEDRYTFTLDSTTSLYFDSLSDNHSMRWRLTGPGKTFVSNRSFTDSDGYSSVEGLLNLPAGAYELTVDAVADVTGPYAFRLFDIVSATPLSLATVTSGTLSPHNATAAYYFNANAGQAFFFDVQTTDQMQYSVWRLLDPYGNRIFHGTFADVDTLSLPASGRYTLLVEGYYGDMAGTGQYSMKVQPVINAAPEPLSLGSLTSGEIDITGQQDRFTFTLPATTNLYLDARTDNGNLRWSLVGPAGTMVSDRYFLQSDWYSSLGGLLNLPAGDYQLTVDGWGDTTGEYQFRLFDMASAIAVTPGVAVDGTLAPRNETDAYRFNADANSVFFFDVQTNIDMGNTLWRLLDPYGREIFYQGFSDVDRLVLPAAGTYTLLIDGFYGDTTGTGQYRFVALPVVDAAPQPITLGSTITGDIAAAGEQDRFTFTLDAPTNLYFDTLGENGSLIWTLTGPAGTMVSNRSFNNSDWQASLDGLLNLPLGDYRLTVDGLGDATAGYQWRLLDLATATAINPGTPVSGALSPRTATHAYRFNANAGDVYALHVLDATDMQSASWRLISPYGKQVFVQNFSDTGNLSLPSSGSYTLLVEGFYSNDPGTSNYQFDLVFQGNTPPVYTGTPMSLGSIVAGEIATAGEQHRYTFTLDSDASLYLDVLSSNDNALWALSGPAGTLVEQRRFYATDWYAELKDLRNLPAGDYTLTLSSAGDTPAEYRVRLIALASGTAIAADTQVAGTLEPRNETDVYRFSASAGDLFYFDTQTSTNIGNASWRLLDPYGNVAFVQYFSDVDTLELKATGTYTLLVEGYNYDTTGSASYSFELQPVATATIEPLALGDAISGTIAVAGEQDHFRFHLDNPASLYFDSLSNSNQLTWTLSGPAGKSIDGRAFSGSDWYASVDALRNLPAGDYTLIVDGVGQSTEDYRFRLFAWASGQHVTTDTIVEGTLSPGDETNAYRFSADAGDQLFFDARTKADMASALWRLVDPFGNQIFQEGFQDIDTLTLPATGDYTLFIEGSPDSTTDRTYSFYLQPVSAPVAQPLALGSEIVGTLGVAGEQNRYAFTLNAQSNLYFDSLSDRSDVRWSLKGPAGELIHDRTLQNSDWWQSLDGLLKLPAGDYALTVDGIGDATGGYRFRLIDIDAAPEIELGKVISGGLSSPMGTSVVRFAGQANQRIFTDTISLGSGLSDSNLRLLDPLGNEVFHGDFNDSGTVTLPVTGTYSLLIEGSRFNRIVSGPVLAGAFGARSGAIADGQATALEITRDVPAGNIAFDRYVSSEGGYDFLRFYVDGQMLGEWSGDRPTERFSYPVTAGTHVFRWEYRKDVVTARGEDSAWIDDIVFPDGATESFESGGLSALPWILSGSAPWSVQGPPPANPYMLAVYEVTRSAPVDLLVSTAAGTSYTYDPVFSQQTSYTDELGRRTLSELDPANGNRQRITEVVGTLGGNDDLVTQLTYTPLGQIDIITDPLGRKTDYDYDNYGRLMRVTSAVGTADQTIRRFEYADLSGNIAAVVDENGNRTEYQYDALNRVVKTRLADPDGTGPLASPETLFSYDARGNLKSTTDAHNHSTQFQYDALDRLVKTIVPSGSELKRSYDLSGNLSTQTDELGRVSRNRYDARNRLVETIDPAGGSTRFAYDGDDNLVSLTDPLGNVTRFEYDLRNRLSSETDALGKVIAYRYDVANNLVEKIDRNGRVTQYAYDPFDRVITETWVGGGNSIHYAYDKLGSIVSINDAFSGLAFTRDDLDRVKTVDNAGTPGAPHVRLSYSYDAFGNVASVDDTINGAAGAATLYAYDALNRTTRITQTGSGLANKRVDYAYDALGQVTSLDRYSDLAGIQLVARTANAYDVLNRLTSSLHTHAAGTLASYSFSYDASNRITRLEDIDGVTTYAYDSRDQLTGADRAAADLRGDETYSYDANGNRISSNLHGTGYVIGAGNRLLSDGKYNYAYDGEGNLIQRTEIATGSYREFTWDFRNRLVAVIDKTSAGAVTQEVGFSYDGLDRRISKAVDLSPGDATDAALMHFVYDREDVLLDYLDADGSGSAAPALAKRYLHGPGVDEVLAQDNAAGSVQWMLSDHLGTVHDLIDNGGVVVNHIVFDSYGNVESQTNSAVVSRYLFTGREFDVETGLAYYRARYYDAAMGRFISEDPIRMAGGDANIYRYVGNQVIDTRDPSGMKSSAVTPMVKYMMDRFGDFDAIKSGAEAAEFLNRIQREIDRRREEKQFIEKTLLKEIQRERQRRGGKDCNPLNNFESELRRRLQQIEPEIYALIQMQQMLGLLKIAAPGEFELELDPGEGLGVPRTSD